MSLAHSRLHLLHSTVGHLSILNRELGHHLHIMARSKLDIETVGHICMSRVERARVFR